MAKQTDTRNIRDYNEFKVVAMNNKTRKFERYTFKDFDAAKKAFDEAIQRQEIGSCTLDGYGISLEDGLFQDTLEKYNWHNWI